MASQGSLRAYVGDSHRTPRNLQLVPALTAHTSFLDFARGCGVLFMYCSHVLDSRHSARILDASNARKHKSLHGFRGLALLISAGQQLEDSESNRLIDLHCK